VGHTLAPTKSRNVNIPLCRLTGSPNNSASASVKSEVEGIAGGSFVQKFDRPNDTVPIQPAAIGASLAGKTFKRMSDNAEPANATAAPGPPGITSDVNGEVVQ
jgi:hypothetical protein